MMVWQGLEEHIISVDKMQRRSSSSFLAQAVRVCCNLCQPHLEFMCTLISYPFWSCEGLGSMFGGMAGGDDPFSGVLRAPFFSLSNLVYD